MAHARASIGTVDYATAITAGHAHTITADEGPASGGKDVTSVQADIHFMRTDKVESVDGVLRIAGADVEQRSRLAEIAEKTPVALTLKRSLDIRTTIA